MHFYLEQIVEKYTCLLSREIGFLVRQIGRARRGAFMAFILDLCAQLICAFVFESAKSRVSHDTAHTESGVVDLSAFYCGLQDLKIDCHVWQFFASSKSINIFVCSTLL